ncbi:hypothetical protein HHI36_012837, partial [Cryptolaemus montrouzieri]
MWSRLRELGIKTSNTCDLPENLKDPNEIDAKFTSRYNDVQPTFDATLAFYGDRHFNEGEEFQFQLTVEDTLRSFTQIESQASGIDRISLTMHKYSLPYVSVVLTDIFNILLRTGAVPQFGKHP